MEEHTLFGIVERIEKKHKDALSSPSGQIRHLELLWQELNSDYHRVDVPTWTDRERGFMKDLLSRYHMDDAALVMRWAVENWKSLNAKTGTHLSPLPVLADFYFRRDEIWAAWRADQQKEELREKVVEERRKADDAVREWKKAPPPERPFSDMVKDAIEAERKRKAEGRPAPRS